MTIRSTPWPAGVPCWADLTAPDVDAAKAFYAGVLGWTFADTGPEYGGYVLAEVGGAAAAGIGPLQGGTPSAWTLYLASADVDATAAAVTEHGGTIHAAPMDVGALGRMIVAADPTGAVFGVWQAGEHIGSAVVNEPGGLTWEDLRSPDPDAARAFYTALFGYRTDPMEGAPPGYTMFALADEEAPLGGMGPMMGADSAPPHWAVYFGVADTATAVTAADKGGGTVLMRDFDTPYGRMAGLADPAGAMFWVVQTDGSDQPDRDG